MSGGAAHIQSLDGSAVTRPAGGGPQEEKLFEGKFALKDVAFSEAGLPFDIERRDELFSDDQIFQIGRELRNGVDHGVAEGFALLVPGAGRQFVGSVLHEAGKDVFSGRSDGGIGERGNDHIDVGAAGKFAVLGLVVGALHIFHGRRNGDRSAKVMAGAGEAGKIREAVESEIYFAGGPAIFVTAHVFQEIAGKFAGFDEFQEREIGVNARRDNVGVNFFAAFENDALRYAIFYKNFRYGHFFADFDAGFEGCTGDGVGNGAGAAAAETPGAEGAVDFAHVMMEQNIGCAGRTDAEECADDSGGGHGGFEDVGLKPLVEEIGRAHGHELDQIVFVFGVEILETLGEEGKFFQVARVEGRGIGRDHAENRLYEAAHGDHGFAEFFVRFGVEFGVTLEFPARFTVIVLTPEVVAVGHGGQGAVEREDLQPVPREIEIANDFRPQQRNDVGEDREFKSGDDFFGDGCAAQDVAFFQDQNFFAGLGEIRRVHQAVMAAADYDDVVFLCHGLCGCFSRSKDEYQSRSILQARERSHKEERRVSLTGGQGDGGCDWSR